MAWKGRICRELCLPYLQGPCLAICRDLCCSCPLLLQGPLSPPSLSCLQDPCAPPFLQGSLTSPPAGTPLLCPPESARAPVPSFCHPCSLLICKAPCPPSTEPPVTSSIGTPVPTSLGTPVPSSKPHVPSHFQASLSPCSAENPVPSSSKLCVPSSSGTPVPPYADPLSPFSTEPPMHKAPHPPAPLLQSPVSPHPQGCQHPHIHGNSCPHICSPLILPSTGPG